MKTTTFLILLLSIVLPCEQTVYAVQYASARIHHATPAHHRVQTGKPVRFPVPAGFPEHRLFSSHLTRLPVLADGQAALPSNANSFHGRWNASVDSRTGNASFSLTAASMMYHLGQAKRQLVISYGGGPSPRGADRFGLGPHWSWNVGTEHLSDSIVAGHQTTDLSTGDGHSFTMESSRNAQGETVWQPMRHKMGDVMITGKPGNWTLSLATGIRVHLLDGYEDWEENRDGQKVWFYYNTRNDHDATRHLKYLCDHPLSQTEVSRAGNACAKHGILLTYQGNTVVVHGFQKITLSLGERAGIRELDRITLPPLSANRTDSQSVTPEITFSYDSPGNRPWLLRRVQYPSGLSRTFLYNEEADKRDARTPGLPTGINGALLPVVTEQITHTGNPAVPDRYEWFHYGTPTSSHNYTGYQGSTIMIPGRDNLLDQRDSYTYSVTLDNGLTRTTTTYNKYHLPLSIVRQDVLHNTPISTSEQTYPKWKNTTFAELPKNYSLSRSSAKTLYAITEKGKNPTLAPVRILTGKQYDDNGQPIWKRDAYGRETYIEYCPEQGDRHCPAMDPGWPQVTRPEKILMMPAHHAAQDPLSMKKAGMAREIVFDYTRLPVLSQNGTLAATHFWQISAKTESTVTPERVQGIKPGAPLPEPASGNIISKTRYRYEAGQKSLYYGQLIQMTITRPETAPVSRSHSFLMARAAVPASSEKEMTFNIIRKMDEKTGTRSTTIQVEPGSHPVSSSAGFNHLKKLATEQGFRFGTTVFSLTHGVTLATVDSLGLMHVAWSYDQWNRPVKKVMTPATGGKPHIFTWRYVFTAHEHAVIETFPDGSQKKSIYSPDNKIISTWHRFKNRENAPVTDNAYWIPDLSVTYNQNGQPASTTRSLAADGTVSQPGKTIRLTTKYGYDALNRPVWEKLPDGRINMIVHDDPAMRILRYQVATDQENGKPVAKLGPLLSVSEANTLGKPVATYTLPLTDTREPDGKRFYPASLGKELQALTASLLPVQSLQSSGSFGLLPLDGSKGLLHFVRHAASTGVWIDHTTLEYDGQGRLIRQRSGNGAVTRWNWNKGELASTMAPDGRIIHDTYNIAGMKISRCVQPAQGHVCHVLGTRGYDTAGHLLWKADEKGNVIRYTWDQDGRKTGMITPATADSPNGHHFTWHYNSFGMTEAALDGSPYLVIHYDPVTWKVTDTQGKYLHMHLRYDPNTGRPVQVDRTAVPAPSSPVRVPAASEKMVWNRYFALTDFTDWMGNRYTNFHDSLNRLVRREVRLPHATSPVLLAQIGYDEFSRPVTLTNGTGNTRTLAWNPWGELASTTDSKEGKLLMRQSYTYDHNTHAITSMTRQEGQLSATESFTYDRMNNLVSMRCGQSAKPDLPGLLCPRDTDFADSMLKKPPIITAQHYTFDPWNNIHTVRESVSTDNGTQLVKTTLYTHAGEKTGSALPEAYDPHQLQAIATHWSNQPYNTRPQTLTYDHLGRIIKDARGNTLHYDAFGHQDRFTNIRTHTTTNYFYDSIGHQIAEQPVNARNHPLQNPLYLFYNGNMITGQMQTDSQGNRHVSAEIGGVAHSEDGTITSWYLHDYKGDVMATLNRLGEKTSDTLYSPYGMSFNLLGLPQGSTGSTPWWKIHLPGFNGQMNDPATGYQFLGGGYRAYNPVYRHFMARDSFSPFRKMDGYGFGDNNPVMNTDPTGHMPKWASYLMASASIAMTIGLSVLTPIAVSGAIAAVSGEFLSSAVIGTLYTLPTLMVGSLGVVAGSLQIASTAHPSNKKLAIATQAFGIVNGATSLILGMSAIAVTGTKILESLASSTLRTIIVSGALGIASAPVGVTASGMGIALICHPEKARKRAFSMGLDILNYLTTGLMLASLTTEIGLGFALGMKKLKSTLGVWMTKKNRLKATLPPPDEASPNPGSANENIPETVSETMTNKESTPESSPKPPITRPEYNLGNVRTSSGFFHEEINTVFLPDEDANGNPIDLSPRNLNRILQEFKHMGANTDSGFIAYRFLNRWKYEQAVSGYYGEVDNPYILIPDDAGNWSSF